MTHSKKQAEMKKAALIEQLLSRGVYKTSDQRHLYDVPLTVLENEYKQLANEEFSSCEMINP
jgi:hypothetical protein